MDGIADPKRASLFSLGLLGWFEQWTSKVFLNGFLSKLVLFCRIVVCNLYPFVKTISKVDCTMEDAVEEIDIGNTCIAA